MTLRERLASAWGAWTGTALQITGQVPDLAEWMLNHPYIPYVNFDEYSEAFKKVPIVQQCTRQIQHDVAMLPRRVYQIQGKTRVEVERKDGNLPDLLFRANPRDTGYQFIVDTVGSLILNGNSYWFLQCSKSRPNGPPVELWSLPAQNVRVTPTENRGVLLYEYRRGGQGSGLAGGLYEPMDPANIIHFRDYNPCDEPIGVSRIEPVRCEFEAQFYALIWLREFFKKGGMVSGVYTPKDVAGLGPQAVKAIQDRLVKAHQGYDKAFNPVVIDAALEYLKQGQTLTEMDLEKNLSIINSSIARSIGVPPMRLGIRGSGANAFNDGMAESDAQNYWFGTIGQINAQIDAVLTEKLGPMFGPNLVIEADLSGVLPIQKSLLNQATMITTATGCPVLTVNEGRQMMGREPLDDPKADELYSAPAPTIMPPQNGPAPKAETPSVTQGPESPSVQQARLARMEPVVRDGLRKRKNADLARYERMMESHFRARFARQRPLALDWIRAHNMLSGAKRVKGIAIAPSPIPIQLPDDEVEMQHLLRTLLIQRGESALADIGVELAFNATSARAGDFIARMADWTLSNVDDTTTAAIQADLALGLEQGETLAQITDRVSGYFDECELSRAALIGRTETTRAYNFASNEAWQQSGVVSQQEWLTARDGLGKRHAEDPAYADLDGQTVGLEEKFQVGNDWLAYPGDPDGDPGETCNCRCTLIPAGIDENLRRELNETVRWERFMVSMNGSGNGPRPVSRVREWVER